VRWIVLRELDRLDEAAYLREHGVIIVSERALQAHSAPVGEYVGRRSGAACASRACTTASTA
jgi:hypothetical protein